MSKKLLRTVSFTAILPADKLLFGGEQPEPKEYKTLYLLHGGFGYRGDYISGTRIQRWAEENNLAVIMPSGENQFYVDKPERDEYFGAFVADELVEFTRKVFPLSDKKADTFIAGLSMGGYGALINGLKYHETFSHIGAFSPGLMNDVLALGDPSLMVGGLWQQGFYDNAIGKPETIKNSEKDYCYLMDQLLENKQAVPNIYMAIGTEDFLLEPVRAYHQFLEDRKVDVTYIEDKGGHEWDFWDKYLKNFLDWLPLDEQEKGLNSGNVMVD
ncbi:MAG: alpha/beta hydrolase family protein [Vagococcus sp.]|nr:alpha/beta hydrolase family protein [Vagococcus sp. DIV0080]